MKPSNHKGVSKRLFRALINILTWPARFLWRKRKIFGWAVFTLIVAHSLSVLYLARRIDSEIAKIKEKGDPVTISDLAGKPVPNSQNSWPIYNEIFKEMKYIKYIDFEKWYYMGNKEDRLKAINGEDKNGNVRLKRIIGKHKHVFGLLDEAVKRPYYRDGLNWENIGIIGKENDSERKIISERMTYFMKVVRFLILKSQLAAYDGKKEVAIEDAKKAFLVAEALKETPTLWCQLVRIAIFSAAAKNINKIAEAGAIDEISAKKLDLYLSKISLDGIYQYALKTERVFVIYNFQNTIHKITGYPARPIFYMDELYYLEEVQKQIDAPLPGPLIKEKVYSRSHPLSEISLRVNYAMGKKITAAIAMQDGTRIFLGLIAYKDKYGLYPKTLDELKTKLNWEVKDDVCSGKPFVYRLKGNGFILYSVGDNGKDDGGMMNLDSVWELDR